MQNILQFINKNKNIISNKNFVLQDEDWLMFVGLWVDDAPAMPPFFAENGWTHARSVWEALLKLDLIEFKKMSINSKMKSDIGKSCIYACDVLDWLEDRRKDNLYVPDDIIVHESYNCVSCPKSKQCLTNNNIEINNLFS